MLADAKERLKVLFGFRQDAEKTLEDPGLMQAFADVRQAAVRSSENSG